MRVCGWPWPSLTGVLVRRDEDTDAHRSKATGAHREKVVICRPGRAFPGEISPAVTLILDFQPPQLKK